VESKIKAIPIALLLSFSLKALLSGLNWPFVAAALIFSGLWFSLEYKFHDKKIKEVTQKLEDLEKLHKEREIIISDLKTSVSSLRMSNGLKPQNFRPNS
jgi:hypothetical protein